MMSFEKNISEVDANDVDLSSFAVKTELNSRLWHGMDLDDDVRDALLDIADDFIDTLAIPWVKVKDIVFTGSLANYNWSEYSDIDLHIVIDFKEVWDRRTDFVKDYFDAKKLEWQVSHDSITVYDFPVEISVEDTSEPSKSSGVYSLKDDEWIREPKDLSDARINKEYVRDTAAKFMTDIDRLIGKIDSLRDGDKKLEYAQMLIDTFKKMRNMRKSGLASKSREMSSGNIIWKILRREGYIESLWNAVNDAYDDAKTLK